MLSDQWEVTAYGGGNSGDDWKVVCDGLHWKRGNVFRLLHVATNRYLAASKQIHFDERNCGFDCPILHHLESFAIDWEDDISYFRVDLGVCLYK